jgi:hypothetical protein
VSADDRDRLDTEKAQARVSVGLFDGRAYVVAPAVGLFAEPCPSCGAVSEEHTGPDRECP